MTLPLGLTRSAAAASEDKAALDSDTALNIQENVPLAPLTTLKVGGPARFFVEARSEEDVKNSLHHASSSDLGLFILGGGSNILVSDEGFDGLVVHIALKGIYVCDDRLPDRALVTAWAGEDWDNFVEYSVNRNLAGIECLSGIPGLVGGTPVQNVGAYGQEVSETIVSVRCLDRERGEIVELSNEECSFAYRTSIFNSTMKDRFVVLSVTFGFVPDGAPKIAYKDLKEHFDGRWATLRATRSAVLGIRAAKSMVIDDADPNSRSAGSFFKNPIVERSKLSEVASRAGVDSVPNFEASGGFVKIPAAWLIEQAGFYKGFAMGNAGISAKHSLAIINRGGATAAEILALKERIIDSVVAKFGIELVPEPIFVGF
jgi:UDP-N-acetylmuramate dehydrogenase